MEGVMNRKSSVKFLFLSVLLFLFFSVPQGFAQDEVRVGEKLSITYPKNLAVFHILVMLTPSGEAMQNRFIHPLAKEAAEYFKEFKSHPAVEQTNKMFKNMWYFVFNTIAFYYSDFPEAKMIREMPAEQQQWKFMEKMISDYIASARDFYISSRFEDFWAGHMEEIQSVFEKVKSNLPRIDIPQLIENFYRKKIGRFYYVPSVFMATSATHVEIEDERGWAFYHLDGFQNYSDSFSNAYYAFHEFSHSFIEPASQKFSREIHALAHLYKPLEKDLRPMGYGNWERAFAEHMVTAGQLHLAKKAFGEKRAEEMLDRELRRGFRLIKHFYGYLKEYDKNREKYKVLEDFYPELLSRLSRLRAEEYRRPGMMGFYPEYRENKLFIKDVVPDQAFAKAGVQKGDILFSVGKDRIKSEESFNRAKERWWNAAKEGDLVKIVLKRNGKKIKKQVLVPFVTDYRFREEK